MGCGTTNEQTKNTPANNNVNNTANTQNQNKQNNPVNNNNNNGNNGNNNVNSNNQNIPEDDDGDYNAEDNEDDYKKEEDGDDEEEKDEVHIEFNCKEEKAEVEEDNKKERPTNIVGSAYKKHPWNLRALNNSNKIHHIMDKKQHLFSKECGMDCVEKAVNSIELRVKVGPEFNKRGKCKHGCTIQIRGKVQNGMGQIGSAWHYGKCRK